MIEDCELLQKYTNNGDDAAFRALVAKYTGLVFGCAYRRTRNRMLAEEITQNVFAALARKAGRLAVERTLAGWLHRSAVLESSAQLRAERRHRRRMEAVMQESSKSDATMDCSIDSEVEHAELLGEIDKALDQLGTADREVVFMRFFEERTYGDIGKHTSRSEEACRKRVTRSLEKLAQHFRRKGTAAPTITVIAGALTGTLTMTPPPALAATASSAALASAASTSPLFQTLTLLQGMAYSKMGGIAAGAYRSSSSPPHSPCSPTASADRVTSYPEKKTNKDRIYEAMTSGELAMPARWEPRSWRGQNGD